MPSPRMLARAIAAALPLALPSFAAAADLEYVVGVGLEHNTNVTQSETDPISVDILEPQVGFTLSQNGSTVQASANGIAQYRDYLNGPIGNEFRGELAGRFNWSAIPDRLDLTTEDYLGVEPVNPLQPDAPNNQQQTNVFAFGPTLRFRFGDTVRGETDLHYINSHAEKTKEFNTQRIAAAVRAIKDLSATSALSANVVDERIEYTNSNTAPDYSRYSVFGRYTRNWTRVDLIADLGYSWIDYSKSGPANRDDPLARVTLSWRPSPHSTFALDAARQISDAASGMILTGDLATTIPTHIATGTVTVTAQPYTETRFGPSYTYRGERLNFSIAPYFRKLDYVSDVVLDQTNLDETGRGATATLSWRLRPLVTTGLLATGENIRYDAIAREDKVYTLSAFFDQQWTRHWSWRLELTHFRRDSTAAGQSSHQNIAFVSVTYAR